MTIPGYNNMYAITKLFDEYLREVLLWNELDVVFIGFFDTYGHDENSKTRA